MKPSVVKSPGRSSTGNPYLDARQEWNERYGDYISQARSWKIAALVSLGVCAVSVVGVIVMANTSRIVPYVVEVNKLGDAVGVHRADQARALDPRVVKAQLARFITSWRSVSPDVAVQKRTLEDMYAFLSAGDPATVTLNEYMKANNPYERATKETVSVTIENVLPLAGETWQIDWLEERRSRSGELHDVKRWRAAITPAFRQPNDEMTILRNPLGLYTREISFSPILPSSAQ